MPLLLKLNGEDAVVPSYHVADWLKLPEEGVVESAMPPK